jgi:hypothetical protein
MTENWKFRKAILSAFYNISQRNFGIFLILWCSFKLWWNFCLDQNLVYNANGPLLWKLCVLFPFIELFISPELDADYFPWSSWGVCSLTCGPGGIRTRTRKCQGRNKPNCIGAAQQSETCFVKHCPGILHLTKIPVKGRWELIKVGSAGIEIINNTGGEIVILLIQSKKWNAAIGVAKIIMLK